MTDPPDDVTRWLREYLDGYSTYPRRASGCRRQKVDGEVRSSRRVGRRPKLLEAVVTFALIGGLFGLMATAFVYERSGRTWPANPPPQFASGPQYTATAAPGPVAFPTCARLTQGVVGYRSLYYLTPPQYWAPPRISCDDAVSIAEKTCPSKPSLCAGAPPPQWVELSVIGSAHEPDPQWFRLTNASIFGPTLVWVVTWTQVSCDLPTSGGSSLDPTPTATPRCDYVDFVDAIRGKFLFSVIEPSTSPSIEPCTSRATLPCTSPAIESWTRAVAAQ